MSFTVVVITFRALKGKMHEKSEKRGKQDFIGKTSYLYPPEEIDVEVEPMLVHLYSFHFKFILTP